MLRVGCRRRRLSWCGGQFVPVFGHVRVSPHPRPVFLSCLDVSLCMFHVCFGVCARIDLPLLLPLHLLPALLPHLFRMRLYARARAVCAFVFAQLAHRFHMRQAKAKWEPDCEKPNIRQDDEGIVAGISGQLRLWIKVDELALHDKAKGQQQEHEKSTKGSN
eukprot:15477652-Alexandrium_andersonii.AAC.1